MTMSAFRLITEVNKIRLILLRGAELLSLPLIEATSWVVRRRPARVEVFLRAHGSSLDEAVEGAIADDFSKGATLFLSHQRKNYRDLRFKH